MNFETAPIKRMDFVKEHLAVQVVSPRSHHRKFSQIEDHITGDLIYRMDQFIWSQKSTYNVTRPINWWEQLKSEKAPKWFLKRFPVVKGVVATVDAKVLFPDFTPITRDVGDPVYSLHVVEHLPFKRS